MRFAENPQKIAINEKNKLNMKRVAKWQHKLSALDLFVKELRTVSYVLTSTQQTTHKNDGTFSFCVCVCDNLLHARDRQHNVEDV